MVVEPVDVRIEVYDMEDFDGTNGGDVVDMTQGGDYSPEIRANWQNIRTSFLGMAAIVALLILPLTCGSEPVDLPYAGNDLNGQTDTQGSPLNK